eukprot:TRINITY_DN45618_c0_g2_i2.p1 TRINITY_DN45618_c0_g2~~TRINITY_DN45618_c0_g2_i2.p1  ORF type:complete len:112 (+),score=10.46 TRINITY_DN45618_c0_g2_i2:89-424(+)
MLICVSGAPGSGRIASLYVIERNIRGKPAESAKHSGNRVHGPCWMICADGTLSSNSELLRAIRCATTRWLALTRYRDDENLESIQRSVTNAAKWPAQSVIAGRLRLWPQRT